MTVMTNDPDGESPNEAEGPLAPHSVRHACEYCRSRKIRCDKDSPCSNCRRAKTECRVAPRTLHQKRTRVLISSQYEKKIDQLDQRLEKLASLIERIGGQEGPQNTPGPVAAVGNAAFVSQRNKPGGDSPENILGAIPEHESRNLMHGESSLPAQSLFAKNFLTTSIETNRECDLGHEMNQELTNLRQIVDAFKRAPLSQELACQYAMPTPPMRRDDYKLPPIETTVALLRSPQGQFCCEYLNHLLGSESLSDICLKVYFSDQYTDAQFIILNAALSLCPPDDDTDGVDEMSREGQPQNNQSLSFLCRRNLETAISRLPLLPPATHYMVLALVLSAAYAIDVSKPSLAWRLTSTASQISYMLGFHMRSEGTDKSTNILNKHGLLFWVLYSLEKQLSLRLGYSSTIQDRDITLPFPVNPLLPATLAMQYLHNTVKLANVAGRIYECLYSSYSLTMNSDERVAHSTKLAQEMGENVTESRRIFLSWMETIHEGSQKNFVRFSFLSDDVLRQSMLTLVHRAVPPKQGSGMVFTEECINSARATLESHETCVATIIDNPRHLTMHFQWAILFAPFVPFIVLFCHVISTGNTSDLARMESFVASVRAAGRMSTAVSKLHRLFEVFCRVAQGFRKVTPEIDPPQPEQQMRLNSCLVELGLQPEINHIPGQVVDGRNERGGLMSSEAPDMGGLTNQIPDDGGFHLTNQGLPLANWVSLNQHMMDILSNDDLEFL